MVSPICILFLIFFHIIKNVYSQETTNETITVRSSVGEFACDYDTVSQAECGTADATIDSLPMECSAFLYSGLLVDGDQVTDTGIEGSLEELSRVSVDQSLFVYYFHKNQMEWCTAVAANFTGLTAELNNLKAFKENFPKITGFILRNLLDTDKVTSADCPNYTQNVKTFISMMKLTFPSMEIGIRINSPKTRETYNNTELAWLDFKTLGSSVNFYVVDFQGLNACSDEFTKTGCYPLSGADNTLSAMKTFLENAGIQSTQMYYSFNLFAEFNGPSSYCSSHPVNYCKSPPDLKASLCMDTIQSLFDKGDFAKQNGAGFVATSINTDDFDSSCQCGNESFPAFRALYNGYKGLAAPPPCALFDRT